MKPILFRTDMVQAIIDGRKTQTRRLSGLEKVNAEPNVWEYHRYWDGHAKFTEKHNAINEVYCKSKYKPGDILYVRETWVWREKHGKFYYRADNESRGGEPYAHNGWKPSLFMPKEAARIFLQVTDVRAERLQDISIQDAEAEGMNEWAEDSPFTAVDEFAHLWDGINAWKNPSSPLSFDSNPWVWVYTFKRIEKPSNYINPLDHEQTK